ncbi:unnamed protein product [Medioppia subpectinata]|uniref:Protein-serine/threonine kinase n=1 Tax=Medioppia subpectinata TaxID=1979941 RepID=A0A7R9Q1T7_9ACAR|nr:unnamed protein product [Medioppia subpectinata]CAG2109597.1 unnamed protein product [Medioppia subpectinata]
MRFTTVLFRDLNKYIDLYSRFNPSPLSIKQFLDFGRKACEKTSFIFLRKELPVRLANIMQELHLLPENLLRMPSVELVQSWYKMSFNEILHFEKSDASLKQTHENFCETLIKIRNRHSNVVQTMAQGVMELKETHQLDQQTEHSIQYFLNRFYMSRISIRMLINQHAALFGSPADVALNNPRHIGCIDPNCNVKSVILDAYENAKFLCDQYYMNSPDLTIDELNIDTTSAPISLVYVPSLMAREDLTLKIQDRGGGIPRSVSHLLFHYMYSTAPQPSVSGINSAPLAGYGYGLPLSRLYARYLQGDLVITSLEGYGTDAIIYLKVLSNEANELLPVFNKTSSKHYRSALGTHDWSSGATHHIIQSEGSNMTLSQQPIGLRHYSKTSNPRFT